jgi:hypothetical protein
MKKITRSIFDRLLGKQPPADSAANERTVRFGLLSILVVALALFIAVPTSFLATQKGASGGTGKVTGGSQAPYVATASEFGVTMALRDVKPESLSPEAMEKRRQAIEAKVKAPSNEKRVKPEPTRVGLNTGKDNAIDKTARPEGAPNLVTNPIQNFDGPDADLLPALFGGRFAPPDTNAAVGPNHVVITTNSMVQVFSKTGVAAGPAVRISNLLGGVLNATDDDGDPIVEYDWQADRWIISQFNLRFDGSNRMGEHIAVSTTGDPTGTYFAYDFRLAPGRFVDYPHFGVWPDGYYMSSNDFTPPGVAPFLGAGFYVFERAKMLVGDPTAKVISFNSATANDGGFLPTNLEGFAPPPVGTPNLFVEFFADEFGPEGDVLRPFAFTPNYTTPASSTLTQLPDVALAAFDARNPAGRADIQQPSGGEGLDSIADRLMHAMNFRVLAGGVQSYVLNFTVNVSGVNPTSAATYQAGIRWTELRRNAGTGAITVNQQGTYAPAPTGGTGRDLWMAAVSQDGEGNIALAANASAPGPTPAAQNPTAIYTGRLPGDPLGTLPQGEVDALSAVTKGVQTATSNRWGDYSSLFVDPADDCTFWGAFEYVDSPTATFDWNTRMFSFKVNPSCVTAPRGTINGTITNCVSGNPIANAIITAPNGYFRQSNGSGTFSMIVTPGTYTVTVTAPGGFGTCTQTVTVAAGGTATVNCCLAPSAIITSAGATLVTEGCTPANGAIDPGETVTVSLCVQNTGGVNTTNLVGTLAATGGVTAPSGPQNYGVVVAGGPPVCRNFTFTASGSCGGTVTASLALTDGATNLGTVTYNFTLGTLATSLAENFDGVTAPALPAGWTTSFTNGDGDCTVGGPLCTLGSNWTTVSSASDTAPNSAFHNDPSCVSDNVLVTPSFAITSAAAQITFRNSFNLEDTFDGGVLEVSSPNINGGAFTDITNGAVGGSFVTGGYTDAISTQFLSPIAGRQAWSGNSGGFITTTANLGPNVNGQTISLRFRFASDCSVGATGWNIDSINVNGGFTCCSSGGGGDCVVTCPANVTVSNDPNQCGAVVNYPPPTTTGTCGTVTCTPPSGSFFPVGTTTVNCTSSGGGSAPQGGGCTTITQSSSQAITPLNSVSCNDGFGHTDNSYWRAFTLSSFGITNAFDVQSIDIGIEEATAGGTASKGAKSISKSKKGKASKGSAAPTGGGSQPVTVRIYTSSTAFPSGFPGSLTQIGTATVNVADQSGTILNVPITGTAAAGSQLVVEVFTPDGTTTGNLFFIGSNAAAETGPSYLSAADCGITTPTTTTAIGFPDMHIVLNVNGCEQTGGTGPSCSFTVTVNDTQPPAITCPANVIAVAAPVCPAPAGTTVNYTPPVGTDNCPGVTTVCVPPPGTVFPVGTTTVTCTATDASGNTATCSFTVKIFNVCVEDRSNPATVLAWNTATGEYAFCCNGSTFTGVGKARTLGCTYSLEHVSADRRVTGKVDFATFRGEGAIQSPLGVVRCTISDNDVRNNTCACLAGPPPASSSTK